MYLLDTNIYINFYDRYYPINHFATFWEKFIPILQNQIMIPDVVVRENMHNPWFKSDLLADNYQRFFNDNADPFPNPDPLSDQYIDTDNAIYGAETQKPEPSLGFNNLWDYITSGIKEMVSEANKTKMVSPPAFNMDSSQIYLNFNYTNTLERIYHISPKKILHIHGSLERNDNLIYGNDKVSSVDTSSFDINFENPNLDELGSRDYPSNYNDFIDSITISESEQKNIKNIRINLMVLISAS